MYPEQRTDTVVQLIAVSLESPTGLYWELGDRARRGCRGRATNTCNGANNALFLPAQQPNCNGPDLLLRSSCFSGLIRQLEAFTE